MKVLIAEDNIDSRRLLVKQLVAYGYTVEDAVNGMEALKKALAEPPDILVTDILMPEMDGYELCVEWKTNSKLNTIPLVFYTATFTSDEDEKFAESLGVDAFIHKTTDLDTFLRILSEVLEKAKSGKINRPGITPPQYLNYITEHNKLLLSKLNKKVIQLEENIVERQKAEQSLKESEEKYSSLVEHGNDSIVIIEEGKVKYANPKLFEMTGYSAEEVIGKTFLLFISPEYRDLAKDRYRRRMAGEKISARYEMDIVTKYGEKISIEVNTSLILKENSVVEMAIIRDTTERKRVEDALRESEEKFRQFFENAQVYCYMISPEGNILEVNSCVCNALGYSKNELIGQPISKLYAPESLPKALDIINQWNKTGLIESEELIILTKDGNKRNILLSTGSIRDREGKLISSVSIQKDITELKKSQMEALQVETLKRLNKAKSELLSNVAHEMRTPLASIKGFIETLLETDVRWSAKQQREFLIEADKETDILNRLIRDLLDVSRIESGTMKLEKQKCTVEDILESSKARLTILTTNNVLDIKIGSGLPSVYVDKVRIAQVITNLVENASKFSPSGSPILIDAKASGGSLMISVTDKGIGMTQETINKLFNRFYQAEQVVPGNKKGTGLGLSICRGIIEAHNGNIWVESVLGKGSTFNFSLPLS